jgi:tagatose-6-phosphate ketose/aldose isomerase
MASSERFLQVSPVEVTDSITRSEILQQPETWLDTLERTAACPWTIQTSAVVTGAGSSCYLAEAIAASWPGVVALPSTDLLVSDPPPVGPSTMVVSVARSGDSPETAGVIERLRRLVPGARHHAITCNPDSALVRLIGADTLLLDPRTNDRSLVMTSSFTNLTLAGTLLGRVAAWRKPIRRAAASTSQLLPQIEELAVEAAQAISDRVVFLASPVLRGAAREATLKVLEISGGRVVAKSETFLGLRHGPMSFLNSRSLVVCFLSSDPRLQRYELDLVRELRAKGLGMLVANGPTASPDLFDIVVPAPAADLPDAFRTPFAIVFAQLLGLHAAARFGVNADNPSPERVITRVVQGVRVYAD